MYRYWTHRIPKIANIYKQREATNLQRINTNNLLKHSLQYKPKLAKKSTVYGHKHTNKTCSKFENEIGYNMYRFWTQTDYQNKHYNINQTWLQCVESMDKIQTTNSSITI